MNLSDVPVWAWALLLAAAAAGWELIKKMTGSKVATVDEGLSGLKAIAKEHYEDNEDRRIETRDLELRMLREVKDLELSLIHI